MNAAADALSRLEMDAIQTGDRQTIDFTRMAQAQQEESKLQDAQDSSLQLRVVDACHLAVRHDPGDIMTLRP